MDGISASVSGLQVAGQSFALSANNVANLNSAGYQAESLVQQTLPQGGVEGVAVQRSQAQGYPGTSNVDLGTEAVNLDIQSLSFQANAKALEVQAQTLGAALDIQA